MSIENIILQHSWRGMPTLRQFVEPNFCQNAAREIFSWSRGTVLLVTGFMVKGTPETDGPPGTMALARAMRSLGFNPVITAEASVCEYFDRDQFDTLIVSPEMTTADYEQILEDYKPVGLISIERCGRNDNGDYCNMRGISIASVTSSVDELFLIAKDKIPTVGIGDGGNEIGMGNLAPQIREHLSLNPCVVEVDHLVLASVSNWGAYGLSAYLETMAGEALLPSWEDVYDFLDYSVGLGSVDGLSGETTRTVDGYELPISQQIYTQILEITRKDVA